MRLTTDLFAYCRERIPKWNTISISGYHMREKGCSAVQEVGFTLANAIAYVQAAIDAGLQVDEFGPRLAFFFNGHNNVFQEVAKFRAARRMWARIMRERFGAKDERSLKMRFHTQTGGVTLAAQQPHNNIVRVALQGFAAVAGGTQSLPHERLRRGARAAERDRRADRAPHPADPRPRVRRRRHRRPVRRLLLRRGAHRRDRGGGAGADRPRRGDGRIGELHPVHPRRGGGVGLGLRGALPPEAGHRRRRERVRDRPGRRGRDPAGGSGVRAPAGRAAGEVQAGARPVGGRRRASRSCGRPAGATPTCSSRCAPR